MWRVFRKRPGAWMCGDRRAAGMVVVRWGSQQKRLRVSGRVSSSGGSWPVPPVSPRASAASEQSDQQTREGVMLS